MKQRAKILLALIPLAILAVLALPSKAYAVADTYVFDQNNTLLSADKEELEAQGKAYADKYGVGVYLLLCDSMGSDEDSGSGRREFARDFYVNNDLGVGTGKDGILFVVAVQSRKYVTVKHFDDSANDPFSDDCVDDLESEAKRYLKKNDWEGAAKQYYDSVGSYLDYFATNGKQWKETSFFGTIVKIAATIAIPLMIAILVVRGEKQAMLTARMQTEAANYLDPNSFVLSVSNDQFINRTMSVTPRPKHNDSDSGGGWHDMGGGFSGSDGGSF